MADSAVHRTAGASAPVDTVTILLDGREVPARPGELVISAADRAGTFIPRFCYHPRMSPVGMCRMCLVEIKNSRDFSLQPACFVPVAEGQEVVTNSAKVKKAQDGVLELLLINHPLDCPVCDKGGECPLQDQTLAYGPGESRFIEEKRHWEKPIPISALVYLDRERCIQCARCTRFADEVAGEPLISFHQRGDKIEVATFPDQPFASYFSGNTVQICPVGALTAAPYRFRARPWDLEQVESSCTLCSVGCRVVVQSSSNRVIRYLGVDSDPVNWSWMCDKGRFGFEAAVSDKRVVHPLIRKGDELSEAHWSDALDAAVQILEETRSSTGPGAIGVLGGARLANEDAYAWTKLAKGVIGTDSVDAQLGDGLPAEAVLGLPRATIDEACNARRVILLAPDLREELPVLFLRLRHAAVGSMTKIIELSPIATSMTEHAAVSLSYRPGEVSMLARALAESTKPKADVAGVPMALVQAARSLLGVEGAARGADHPAGAPSSDGEGIVVVLGRPSLSESASSVTSAAAFLAQRWPKARFLSALRRANVHGALDMGMSPAILPGRVGLAEGREWFAGKWPQVPSEPGLDALGMVSAAAEGRLKVLVLLGADPMSDFPDRHLARKALERVSHIIAVDCFLNDSSARADVVLPPAMYAERPGTTTNLEGRVSYLGQKVVAPGHAWPDWMIAAAMAERMGHDLGFGSLEHIWEEIERLAPSHRGLNLTVLGSLDTRDGVVVPLPAEPVIVSSRGADHRLLIDPMATPGIDAVERQGAPSRVGPIMSAETSRELLARSSRERAATGVRAAAARPQLLRFSLPSWDTSPTALDSYSLRLVVSRRLYDRGTLTQASPSLSPLADTMTLRVNPYDLDRLGVATGGQVKVRSNRGSRMIRVTADSGVPKGVAEAGFNLGKGEAAELIDAAASVTDIRLETVHG